MVRIQDDESATPYTNRVQKAGMLCRQPQFQDFMRANSEDEAAQKLCVRCGIASRSELNGNYDAQTAFDELIATFETWSSPNDDPF
jgi:Zn ribbon nucleic-acid-binding protein